MFPLTPLPYPFFPSSAHVLIDNPIPSRPLPYAHTTPPHTDNALILSEIPGWPNISGAPVVAGWNSINCSSCWELTLLAFDNPVIHLLAVDVAQGGFNVGLNVLNNLTRNNAIDLGRVPATARRVAQTSCEEGQSNKPPAPHASKAPMKPSS